MILHKLSTFDPSGAVKDFYNKNLKCLFKLISERTLTMNDGAVLGRRMWKYFRYYNYNQTYFKFICISYKENALIYLCN